MSCIGYTQQLAAGTSKPAAGRKARRSPEPFTVLSYIVVTLFGLFCLVPLWMIIAGSFTEETVLAQQGYSRFPQQFWLTAYELLFGGH